MLLPALLRTDPLQDLANYERGHRLLPLYSLKELAKEFVLASALSFPREAYSPLEG